MQSIINLKCYFYFYLLPLLQGLGTKDIYFVGVSPFYYVLLSAGKFLYALVGAIKILKLLADIDIANCSLTAAVEQVIYLL